ncbi:MAG: hypothetical protein PVG39_17820 [Desulfobacteraceae bacterium]
MKSHNDQIKKTVGKSPDKSPLQKLKEINMALKKLGCKNVLDDSETVYRKIVGKR